MDTTTTQTAPSSKQKKLVLHFDINKTLVLADTKFKFSKEEALNYLLSKSSWGRIEQKDSEQYWKLVHPNFSTEKPQENLINYNEYISQLHPEITSQEEAQQDKRDEANLQINQKRQQYYNTFCRSSNPGMKLKPEYDRMMKNICIPTQVYEDIKLQIERLQQSQGKSGKDGTLNSSRVYKSDQECIYPSPNKYLKFFSDGKYQILPGFFRMIIQLIRLKRDFTIIFHSFADNLYDIIAEFNLFCRGEHPCYNGKNNTPNIRLDGVKSEKNFIIQERSMGLFYRYNEDINESALVMGTLKRVPKIKHLEDEYEKELEDDSVSLHKGLHSIYNYINQISQERGALVINHDYQFWLNNGQKNTFSKPLLIDQQQFDTLNIFFDDNITEDDNCIIDLRDAITGQNIPIKKSINKYLATISFLDLLRDPDYFIKTIDLCEKKREEEIYRMVNGVSEDEAKKPEKSKFEILQESNKSEYLRNTVLPLLYPAFQLVDLERPVDPISFIALYCLKNQEKVRVPTPTEEYLQEHQQKYQSLVQEINNKILPEEIEPQQAVPQQVGVKGKKV